MASRIKISQAGLSAGVAGVARTDGLDTGALVTLEDVSGTGNSTFHLLWGPPEDTTAQSSLAATGDPDIWTFSPTAAVYGSYLIELRDNGVPIERRVFGIRTPANQLLIPALNERASRHAGWGNDGADEIEASENNATDFPDADLNAVPYAGWWRSLRELYEIVEFGTGSIADHALTLSKLVQVPAKSVLANATNATGNVTTAAGSGAYQYLRVNSANDGLEWATLSTHASTSIVYAFNQFVRAQLTGAITSSQNSNTTAFGNLAARSVLANTTNSAAVPGASAPGRPLQSLRGTAAGTGLEWAGLGTGVETAAGSVSAALTRLDLTGTYAIPANTLVVGSRFSLTGTMRFTRGATATALKIGCRLEVGGTTALAADAAQANTTNGFSGTMRFEADFTVVTTGAAGTARANLITWSDCDATATAGNIVTRFLPSMAIDTTVANNLRVTGSMDAAVAGTTILATGGHIIPVAA